MGFDVPMFELLEQDDETRKIEDNTSWLWQKASRIFLQLNDDYKKKAFLYLSHLLVIQEEEEIINENSPSSIRKL